MWLNEVLYAEFLHERRVLPWLQVGADFATACLQDFTNWLVALGLGRHGIIDEIGRAHIEPIEDVLRHRLLAQIAHAHMGSQERTIPVELRLGIHHDDQDRRAWRKRDKVSPGGRQQRAIERSGPGGVLFSLGSAARYRTNFLSDFAGGEAAARYQRFSRT